MTLVKLRKSATASARDPGRFLPTTREEMRARGWDELDILIVNGDAYVDHPAFGGALIGRFLEARGFRVGMIAQPAWQDTRDLLRMGVPRIMVGITAGNLDSMLNKLTAQKKVRSEDQYSPGGKPGLRPTRASIVYGNLCRQAFPGRGIRISAQSRLEAFYAGFGFVSVGEPYLEDGIPHTEMLLAA